MKDEYFDVALVLVLVGLIVALISIVVSSLTGLVIAAAFNVAGLISLIIEVYYRD